MGDTCTFPAAHSSQKEKDLTATQRRKEARAVPPADPVLMWWVEVARPGCILTAALANPGPLCRESSARCVCKAVKASLLATFAPSNREPHVRCRIQDVGPSHTRILIIFNCSVVCVPRVNIFFRTPRDLDIWGQDELLHPLLVVASPSQSQRQTDAAPDQKEDEHLSGHFTLCPVTQRRFLLHHDQSCTDFGQTCTWKFPTQKDKLILDLVWRSNPQRTTSSDCVSGDGSRPLGSTWIRR